MNFKSKIKKLFHSIQAKQDKQEDKAFLVFQNISEVITAEEILRKESYDCKIMAPPADLRTGCDMVLVFDLIVEPAVKNILAKHNLFAEKIISVESGLLEPLSLVQIKDFGQWLMVRAANMKITIQKDNGKIVNVSGGGCPDVPFLAARMLNKSILEAEEPRIKGQTLCSFSLQKAFAKQKELYEEQKAKE